MVLGKTRDRSASELVFGVLKTLMAGYQIWGTGSGVQLAELCGFLRTTDGRLVNAIAFLTDEGLVCLDEIAGTVRLTDSGARNLFGDPLA